MTPCSMHIVQGSEVWLHEAQGRRYLGAYNNAPVIRHYHPRVVATARRPRKAQAAPRMFTCRRRDLRPRHDGSQPPGPKKLRQQTLTPQQRFCPADRNGLLSFPSAAPASNSPASETASTISAFRTWLTSYQIPVPSKSARRLEVQRLGSRRSGWRVCRQVGRRNAMKPSLSIRLLVRPLPQVSEVFKAVSETFMDGLMKRVDPVRSNRPSAD